MVVRAMERDSVELRLVDGRGGEGLPLDAFVAAVGALHGLLQSIDLDLAGTRGRQIDWRLTGLAAGSMIATITGRPLPAGLRGQAVRVIDACLAGLREIRFEGTCPPAFSDSTLTAAERLARAPRKGLEQLLLRGADDEVAVNDDIRERIRGIRTAARALPGSVEGTLDMVSLHGRSNFAVWERLEGYRVECYFDDELLPDVKRGLGHRVSVAGQITYSREGIPRWVEVERLDVYPARDGLPSVDQFIGMAPDFTDGVDAVEYVRRLRDE